MTTPHVPPRRRGRAILLAVTGIVLLAVTAVAARPAGRAGTAHLALILAGANGSRAGVELQGHYRTPGQGQDRVINAFAIRVRNLGTTPIDVSLDDAWVQDATGATHRADPPPDMTLTSVSGDPVDPSWQFPSNGYLSPGRQSAQAVLFTLPPDFRPARLRITLGTNFDRSPAQWDL
ncbi:hypothetical protein BJY16_006092 [Actinoplanes octamycinicus]|uniref:DUF4352 domain-containing protein n=1 Tax=Actinoplanes octamycinicus TaxID=135948 RepID=A0A7W7H266_9ACTN|nr:hypothetical protein [Actinoplanes octamycinicus]MBB4742633.1 hypothetical protein [Actinoplanes octamycinicus]GIE60971.1 hypothetical protein Aoc01nite_63730 [Actinoplanes octamycinicus]